MNEPLTASQVVGILAIAFASVAFALFDAIAFPDRVRRRAWLAVVLAVVLAIISFLVERR